jgi:CDP-paratose 2-epimerase
LDNLKRRGSELNLAKLRAAGVEFVHGDIRRPEDLEALGTFDLLIEASAEPSVLAGVGGSPQYALQTNLVGTLNCLEFARDRVGHFLFLSTSRTYSVTPLRDVPLREDPTRFAVVTEGVGFSPHGINEFFPTDSSRSIYGATKLASEMFVQEYASTYGLHATINRCGVIAGPGQFGKVDQGVFTLWVAHHFFGKPLQYTGFGGTGKQVRDLLHPADLLALLHKQIERGGSLAPQALNVGGGVAGSVSLAELTALCREIVGREVPLKQVADSAAVDIPYYVSDSRQVSQGFAWEPRQKPRDIVQEIYEWLRDNEKILAPLFA